MSQLAIHQFMKGRTNIERFIFDAYMGGWLAPLSDPFLIGMKDPLTEIGWGKVFNAVGFELGDGFLLEPEVWRAVGEVRGWIGAHECSRIKLNVKCTRCNMHLFMDYLLEGDDIETALGKL
jgi:hypothetical protein